VVYSPREDSLLLEAAVKKFASGRFLDLGCGSGIQGIAAAKKGCSVTCADIDPEAVSEAKKAFSKRKLKADFVVGDLFENVEGAFDCIAFNPPYLPGCKGHVDLDGGVDGLEVTRRFLEDVEKHLIEGGIILLVATSLCGQDAKLKELLAGKGFEASVAGEQRFSFERLSVLKAVK